jgi:ADP-ribose pyrophosphatase
MELSLIDKQVVYDGRKVRLEVHTLENDQGGRIRKEIVVHPGAVVILPFLDPNTLILIRNRRYTIGQVLIELPAGTLEKGESPMNCAGRELQEETGYLATRMKPLGTLFASPGILTEKMYLFAAYDLEKTQRALEADEDIELAFTPWDDAVHMIQFGEIQDAKTVAAILMYDRFVRVGAPGKDEKVT